VLVFKIFQKLIVVLNLKDVISSMHLLLQETFAFIGGDASIECHFSNIYVELIQDVMHISSYVACPINTGMGISTLAYLA